MVVNYMIFEGSLQEIRLNYKLNKLELILISPYTFDVILIVLLQSIQITGLMLLALII